MIECFGGLSKKCVLYFLRFYKNLISFRGLQFQDSLVTFLCGKIVNFEKNPGRKPKRFSHFDGTQVERKSMFIGSLFAFANFGHTLFAKERKPQRN